MQSNLTGIIIDDDYDEVDVLSMFLEIKGYDVVGKGRNGYDVVGKGRNGYDVVTLYEKNNPDFVILGVNMSQCAGTHAIEEIKKIPQIIGGIDYKSIQEATKLFQEIGSPTISVDSLETAEIIKLINN